MDFGKFDVIIFMTMSIAVIGMSFTMPALGLTDAGTDENDIPEFNISSDRFDLAGDFPDPGTPSSGSIEIHNNSTKNSDNYRELDSDHNLLIVEETDLSNPDMQVMFAEISSGNSSSVYFNESKVGDAKTINDFYYDLYIELDNVENRNQSNFSWSVEYEIRDQPSDEGWLGRVPIVGSLYSGTEALASIVGWIGSVIYWGVSFIVEMALNVVGILFDTVVYMIDTVTWLTGTYGDVISSANSWASVFVAIPGILLFLEFAKIVFVIISLLPTT